MRFLLLAPTDEPVAGEAEAELVSISEPAEPRLRSRAEFDAIELLQRWLDQPTGPDLVADADVVRAAVCWTRTFSVLALEVDVEDVEDERAAALEARLTDIATAYATSQGIDRLAWVGRVAMVDDPGALPQDWLGDDVVTVALGEEDSPAELRVSWGNSVAVGVSTVSETRWRHTVRGLVDAQSLWRELSYIAERSAEATRRTLVTQGQGREGIRAFLARIEDLSSQAALHNLAYDELLTAVQGARRRAALAALQTWQYAAVLGRVGHRLSDLEAIALKKSASLNARYQRTVEAILFALGTATLLELALSLVSTAWSGGVDSVPGDRADLHVLSGVREIGADPIILFAVALLIVGALWLRRSKDRS